MSNCATKSENLYLLLRDEIVRRADGERFWSIREIMKRYEVSQLVVDRTVATLRAERLLDSVPGRGLFIRNSGIEEFDDNGAAKCVLLLLPRWISSDVDVLQRTAKELSSPQHPLRIEQFDYVTAVPRDLGQITRNLAGLIILPSGAELEAEDVAAICEYRKNCPVVILGRHLEEMQISCIGLDDAYAAQQAAHHLACHGHRVIGILLSEPHNRVIMSRVRGVLDYVLLHGLEYRLVDCETLSGELAEAKAYHKMAQVIRDGFDFTGMVAVSGDSVSGAIRACHNHDVRIPDDLSVVSIAAEDLTATSFPPLDTVPGELANQLRTAFQFIHQEVKEDMIHRLRYSYLKTELLTRGSVSTLPVSNKHCN